MHRYTLLLLIFTLSFHTVGGQELTPISYGVNLIETENEAIQRIIYEAFLQEIQRNSTPTSFDLPENAKHTSFHALDELKAMPYGLIKEQAIGELSIQNGNIYLNKNCLLKRDSIAQHLKDIEFFEVWDFNTDEGVFTKTVKQLHLKPGIDEKMTPGLKTQSFTKDIFALQEDGSYSPHNQNLLCKNISYGVAIGGASDSTFCMDHVNPDPPNFYNFLSFKQRMSLVNKLISYIKNEFDQGRNPVLKNGRLLSYEETYNEIYSMDTMIVWDPEYDIESEIIVENSSFASDIHGFYFHESWHFDTSNFSFNKYVHSLDLIINTTNDYGEDLHYLAFEIRMRNPINGKEYSNFSEELINEDESRVEGEEAYEEEFYYADFFTYETEEPAPIPDSTYFLKDSTGKRISRKYKHIGNFKRGLAPVFKGKVHDLSYDNSIVLEGDGSYGIIDSTGKEILKCKYDELNFDEQHHSAIFSKNGLSGWFNSDLKKIALKPRYSYIESYDYNSGLHMVFKSNPGSEGSFYHRTVKGKHGAVNKEGEFIIPCEYDYISIETDPLVLRVFKGSLQGNEIGEWLPGKGIWGIMDAKGRFIVPATYESIGKFYFNRALVQQEGKYGFIDTNGQLVIPCIYEDANAFNMNYREITKVQKDGEVYFIDINGEKVL